MADSNGKLQEGIITMADAADIIQRIHRDSDPVHDNDEIRLGPQERAALQMAYEAVVLRTPRPAVEKTIFEGPGTEEKLRRIGAPNYLTLKCPTCNFIVTERRSSKEQSTKFCHNCGQALSETFLTERIKK